MTGAVEKTTFGALVVGARFRFHDGVNHPDDLYKKVSDRQAESVGVARHGTRINPMPSSKVLLIDG